MSESPNTVSGSQSRWEEAFLRFETPEQERRKFEGRLRKLGAASWPRDSEIVDLFCGRGQNLVVLESMGFTRLEGMDLSPNLLGRYSGPARMIQADCRNLPLPDASRDIVVIQGGLHHLPGFPQDLEKVLDSILRILRPDGRLVLVEPWDTPYLRCVLFCSGIPLARRLWRPLDAFHVMVEEETPLYQKWLGNPEVILERLRSRFGTEILDIAWARIAFVGRPKT
jgi:SAM-dependent methyltransferase